MKIAIYHNLPTGGAKRALYEIMSRMHKDHELHLFTPSDSNEQFLDLRPLMRSVRTYDCYPGNQGITNKLRNLVYGRDINQIIRVQRKIAEDINTSGCDVVFVTNCVITQSPAILSLIKLPTVFYAQEALRSGYEYLLEQGYYSGNKILLPFKKLRLGRIKKIDANSIRSAQKVLCNSYFSAESLARAYGIFAQVCYLGVGSDFQNRSNRVRNNSVAVVGAFESFKNQMLVVEAVSSIQDKRPSIDLVFDRLHTDYSIRVREFAKSQGVVLNLHHRASEDKLRQIYSKSLATICVSTLEPFGFTPLESMMSGTPVIAVNMGGYRETVINNQNGYLIKLNVRELAEKIMLIQNHSSKMQPGTLVDYVKNNWSWKDTVTQVNNILVEAATSTSR